MRESWSGKVIRLIEINCYDCDAQETLHNISEAKRDGWRKRGGWWRCPSCQKPKIRKAVPDATE